MTVPHTSDLAAALAPDVLDRLLRYVRIDTQSDRAYARSPSTPGQLELARLLVSELLEIGLADAAIDDLGFVTATLPATVEGGTVIGLLAHVDTSPDAPGAGVEPLVHEDYDGGVIALPRNDTRLDPERMPELAAKRGHDIVTTSGDTLLGADDKAGVAEVMAAVAYLAAHPELPRPTIRVGFTPDEEVGQGAKVFDLERFGADCAYTLDGSEAGEFTDETFTAASADVRIRGRRRPSRLRDRQAGERDPARGGDPRQAAAGAHAGGDRRPRGVHPRLLGRGLGRRGDDPHDRARLRRRPARRPRRTAPQGRRGRRGDRAARGRRGRGRAAVPEHADVPRRAAGGRRPRPRRRCAARASSRAASRSAAAPTARS